MKIGDYLCPYHPGMTLFECQYLHPRPCNWCGEDFTPELAGITLCPTCMGSE